MTRDDLAQYQSEWAEPIATNYHGYDASSCRRLGLGLAVFLRLTSKCA